MMKIVLGVLLACLVFSSVAFAECHTTLGGKTVCDNGQNAAAVNPKTDTAVTAQKDSNGVTTTKSSKGGQAKTKNGKGVYKAPNGTTCAKTANNQGCQ
jgi:hypothetical protein